MAVYRCEVKRISRASGRSAVASAAYRTGERLVNAHDGNRCHDYRRRAAGIAHTEILTPAGAPSWATDRGALWNAAEVAERRKDGTPAREVILSLPHELDDAQRARLVREFGGQLVQRYGVAVDLAVHRPDRQGDQRNHHAHLMMTTRRLTADGLGEKTRELDDRTQGPEEIRAIRQLWEDTQNKALARAQAVERVSCQSLAAQGIDREPQAKIGEKFQALGRQGIEPRVCADWQEVARRYLASRSRPRHRFERQALARKSSMRQAMERRGALRREQRGLVVEVTKSTAMARALEAARKQALSEMPALPADAVRLLRKQVREASELAERHAALCASVTPAGAVATWRQRITGDAGRTAKRRREVLELVERERKAQTEAHQRERVAFAKAREVSPARNFAQVKKTNGKDFGMS